MTIAAPTTQSLRSRRVTPGARGWLPVLLLPISIGLGLVYFAAVEGLALGFTDWNLITAPSWVGADNFIAIIHDDRFWISLKNTVGIVVLTVPAKMFIGLLLALLLHRVMRFSSFFRL